MQFQRMPPLPFPNSHPSPRFCILRPGGTLTPLIPADELPHWLQISNFTPEMFMGLKPVSLNAIPRDGEYDFICNHCSSSADSTQQSVSGRNEDSPRSSGSHSKGCPNVLFSSDATVQPPSLDSKMDLPAALPAMMQGQPPFTANFQSPFYGALAFNMPNFPGIPFNMVPNMVPLHFLSQLPSYFVNSSPAGSDDPTKESLKSTKSPPRKPSLNASDLGDSDSLFNLSPLPPPAVPLGSEEDHPKTPAPCSSSKHPISPNTQCKISHAIAASLCSVSVENENCPPQAYPEKVVQRRQSIGQASTGNIARSVAASLCSVNGSIASTAPLAAAMDHFKDSINLVSVPPKPASDKSTSSSSIRKHPRSRAHSRVSLASSKPLSRASSRAKRIREAAKKHRERASRRREKRKKKLEGTHVESSKGERRRRAKSSLDDGEPLVIEKKAEQVNSSTKRRDRREKMARGRKDNTSKSQYVHMSMTSNARPNISGH